ncbi:MAG: hypothetical protein HFI82_10565 [Eubacterium sp.]|jgi:uncharacterized phage protein gp47/JayE|nr:hypothetical protein [Eubacterium sp.]
MFEEKKTEEYWMDLAEDLGEDLGVDTREGSVYMDMASGHCIRIAKFYNDLDMLSEMLADDTATGDILTEKAARDNVERIAASPSYWTGIFEGTVPEEGSIFLCGEYEFVWQKVKESFLLVSKLPGTDTNMLKPGSELLPEDTIENLERAFLGELVEMGKAEERDEALRSRWKAEKRMPSRNGNGTHYKIWCEEVEGVGRARILPLWGGNLTVKAILLSDSGKNVSEDVVKAVQCYVDPIRKGYPVVVDGNTYVFGDGWGEGVANLGAHFLAESAIPIDLAITADIDLVEGYTLYDVKVAATEKIVSYLSRIALQSQDNAGTVIRISTIGSIIADLEGVLDYDYESLLINGETENIMIDVSSVAVLSEVEFYVRS